MKSLSNVSQTYISYFEARNLVGKIKALDTWTVDTNSILKNYNALEMLLKKVLLDIYGVR